jgi:hypothetical protein
MAASRNSTLVRKLVEAEGEVKALQHHALAIVDPHIG